MFSLHERELRSLLIPPLHLCALYTIEDLHLFAFKMLKWDPLFHS